MKIKVTIPKANKVLLGTAIVNHIRDRTLEGKDKDGKAFKHYSTNTFAMPSGAITKRALSALDKAGDIIWFTTKTGAEWVLIKGGYKRLKAVKRPSHGGTVNLTDTGKMMADLTVISYPADGIRIGFNRAENAQKASWNIEMGRDFFGIEDSELEKMAEKFLSSGLKVEVVE